jgi:hypothetical protein
VRNLTGKDARNQGAASRLNQLCRAARGEYIAVLNSDDEFVAGRFDVVRHILRRTPSDFVAGVLSYIDEAGRTIGNNREIFFEAPGPRPAAAPAQGCCPDVVPSLLRRNFIGSTSNMIFTRTMFESIGGFAEYRYVHDWDFALRAALRGRCHFTPHPLTRYRDHVANTMKTETPRVDEEVVRMLRSLVADHPCLASDPRCRPALTGTLRRDLDSAERLGPAVSRSAVPGSPPAIGQPSGPPPDDPVLVMPPPAASSSAPAELAVLLHAYYPDTIEEMKAYLGHIPFAFALMVTTDSDDKRRVVESAFAGWPGGSVEVRVVENRGRDIAPKLLALADAYDRFPLVLHLHTKKSPHDGVLAGWRRQALQCLLGSPALVRGVVDAFVRVPELGMLAPRVFPAIRPLMGWGQNFAACRELAARMGVAIGSGSPLDFPSGSMFWARSAALRPLLDLQLQPSDFPDECGQTDGTLAHAIERLCFFSCEQSGLVWMRCGSGDDLAPPEVPVAVAGPGELRQAILRHARRLTSPDARPGEAEAGRVRAS